MKKEHLFLLVGYVAGSLFGFQNVLGMFTSRSASKSA